MITIIFNTSLGWNEKPVPGIISQFLAPWSGVPKNIKYNTNKLKSIYAKKANL